MGLLISFESYQAIIYSNRQSRKRMVNSLLMVHITSYVRDSLEDKSLLLTHSYFLKEKKYKIGFVSLASR